MRRRRLRPYRQYRLCAANILSSFAGVKPNLPNVPPFLPNDWSQDFNDLCVILKRTETVENKWPNVSTNFRPLTLMQGWVSIDINNFENEIADLTH
jgi:hypothetical protein